LKTPICLFDAKTGILCSKCDAKLTSGQLSHAAVFSSIKLAKLAEKDQEISKFTLVGSHKVDDDYILFLRTSDIITIRSNPAIVQKFAGEFNANIWFVEAEGTDRRFMDNLFYPLRVLNMNLIWLPDGNKLTRVIVNQESGKRSSMPLDVEKIRKVAKAVKKIELIIEFETQSN
jgi:transcription antitermination factor NusA-like protein